ncbi:hypothetical protein [Arthrobacter sp. 35W]|uniref:hypothetical protein n=1 Tax=Arthrobacter sp. 35W TaxID=1132441 RepID=UPI00041BCE21|nr:hypothetical protein [Arthrobacter sp. 35W]
MKDNSATGAVPEQFAASGPTASPWMNILRNCAIASGAAVVLLAGAAALAAGPAAALSVVFGAAVVMAFFALSLLVGHYYGRRNPSGAVGVFLVTYLVKVVGFAALLFAIGAPQWLERMWFFAAAVVVVLLWQATEVFTFARQRHQIYDDPSSTSGEGR